MWKSQYTKADYFKLNCPYFLFWSILLRYCKFPLWNFLFFFVLFNTRNYSLSFCRCDLPSLTLIYEMKLNHLLPHDIATTMFHHFWNVGSITIHALEVRSSLPNERRQINFVYCSASALAFRFFNIFLDLKFNNQFAVLFVIRNLLLVGIVCTFCSF